MSDTKIFSLGDQGGLGGGGMASLIASLCQNRGLDPNMVAAMMNNNRGGYGWGDGNGFMWVIFLFFLMGWGNNGWGNGLNRGGLSQGGADLAALINNDNGRELLMSAIQGNGQAISQLASTLNCDINAVQSAINNLSTQILQVGNQVGMSGQQVINAIQAGNCNIASQLASCCCEIKNLVTTQGYENQLRTVQQTGEIKANSDANYNSLAQKIDAQTILINDRFCQLEMREKDAQIQALRDERTQYQMSALLQAQSANLIGQLQPVAKPAYLTCSPYQQAFPFGYPSYGSYPYGYNNGGCCGNNGGCNNGCGC